MSAADIPTIPRPTDDVVAEAERVADAKALLRELQARTKQLKETIDAGETRLQQFLEAHHAPIATPVPLAIGITGTLIESKRTKPFNESNLTEMATAYFEGDTEEADALVTYLYDNREQEVVRKLKFTDSKQPKAATKKKAAASDSAAAAPAKKARK